MVSVLRSNSELLELEYIYVYPLNRISLYVMYSH